MTSLDPLGLTPLQRARSDVQEWLRTVSPDPIRTGTRMMTSALNAFGVTRAELRAESPRAELTLDAVLEKLGWSREYAEHFVQPYCTCDDTYDGWMYCSHARDEGVCP